MSQSIFTKIRLQELPGTVLFEDDKCFVMLTNMPHNPGHLLIIPIKEVADWQELGGADFAHLMIVAQFFGRATKVIYNPPKVSLVAVGFDVPHLHIHIFSLFTIADADHTNARPASLAQRAVEAEKFEKYIKQVGGVKL